jgi:hypothetical protein
MKLIAYLCNPRFEVPNSPINLRHRFDAFTYKFGLLWSLMITEYTIPVGCRNGGWL